MITKTCIKPSFCILGKEGSTWEGPGFIKRLWAEANAQFADIAPLVKRDAQGRPMGLWGAMSDFSRAFAPWENDFSQGLYLAGAEAVDGAQAPAGWTLWTVPGFVYLVTEEQEGAFGRMIEHLDRKGIPLAGAVQEYTSPAEGRAYLYFPIRRL